MNGYFSPLTSVPRVLTIPAQGVFGSFDFVYLGDGPIYSAFESVLALKVDCNEWPIYLPALPTGSSLEEILDKLRETETELKRPAAQRVLTLTEHMARLRENAGWHGPLTKRTFTAEEVIAIVGESQPERSPYEFPAVTFQTVLLAECRRNIIRRVWNWLRAITARTYETIATFCGVSWLRRFWFLLHGSHPPKTEVRPFDCQYFGWV